MNIKESLLTLIDQAHQQERLLASRLTPQEIVYVGTPEHWSGRDMLAHNSAWKQHLAVNLERAARREPIERDDDYQDANERIFSQYHDFSLEQVLAFCDQVAAQLSEQVQALDQEALLSPDLLPGQQGRPLWRSVVSSAYTHPVIHLTDFYVKRGDIDRAAALQEDAANHLGPMDDSPDWQGEIRYNLACFFSLAGQKERAIETLEGALQMAPELTGWSKQDPDFAAIRDEAEFQAIYTRLPQPG